MFAWLCASVAALLAASVRAWTSSVAFCWLSRAVLAASRVTLATCSRAATFCIFTSAEVEKELMPVCLVSTARRPSELR